MDVQREFGGQVRFVGVPGLASAQEMGPFVAEHGANGFPHILDDGVIWRNFGVVQQRTYVFIDDDGSWRVSGYGNLRNDVINLINS